MMGVTHTIRARLNFLDERLWKRFSARRLELIDTLDLSLRKASEQEDQIHRVAEALRVEFGYTDEYKPDFDKLVRAAVQSVRRNRKRSSRAKQHETKRPKRESDEDHTDHEDFLAEITKLRSDRSQVYDMSYPRVVHFSNSDRAKQAIEDIVKKLPSDSPSLPPLAQLHVSEVPARSTLVNLIERSKSCNEVAASTNLQELGRAVVAACTAYLFEHSLAVDESSLEYLREKLRGDVFLCRVVRALGMGNLDAPVAAISLHALLGGCVKDFGFDAVLMPLCDVFYAMVLQEYPLLTRGKETDTRGSVDGAAKIKDDKCQVKEERNDIPYESADPSNGYPVNSIDSTAALSSLATIAAHLRNQQKKKVTVRFLASVLEFLYPIHNSAPPRYLELLENACTAFKLDPDVSMVRLRCADGTDISCDSDVERVFRTHDCISLEVFTEESKPVPVDKLTSLSVPSKKPIILPPITKYVGPRKDEGPRFQPLL